MDEIDFTAPKADQYLKLDDGITYTLTFVERLEDHEEFKLGKGKKAVAAPVYRVRNAGGKEFRLSVTSTQLAKSLEQAEKHFGRIIGTTLKVRPEGDGTERTYRVSAIATPANEQRGLNVGA